MKKQSFILLALVAGFVSVNAQLSTYRLSSYKLPSMARKSLDASLAFNEAREQMKSDARGEQDDMHLSGHTRLAFNSFVNREDLQRNIQTLLELPFYYNKYSRHEFMHTTPSLHCDFTNKKFFEGEKFTEFNFNLAYELAREKDTNSQTVSYNGGPGGYLDLSNDFNIGISVKNGTGRIERVQYARQAIYILEDLKKKGRIGNVISHDLITRFADRIAKLQNKRFFDGRIYRFEVIEALDSFLTAEKLVSETDARYFTSLIDMWGYGNRQIRKSGTCFGVEFSPSYSLLHIKKESYNTSNYTNRDRASAVAIKLGFEFDMEHPFKQKWQYAMSVGGYVEPTLFNLKTERSIVTSSQKLLQEEYADMVTANLLLGFSQSIGYYPSTRTDITFGYDARFIHLINIDNETNNILATKLNGSGVISNLKSEINYYFSPRVSLKATISLFYFWQYMDSDLNCDFDNILSAGMPVDFYGQTFYSNYKRGFDQSFIIGLNYAIF